MSNNIELLINNNKKYSLISYNQNTEENDIYHNESINSRPMKKLTNQDADFELSETLEKVIDLTDWEFDYELGISKLENDELKIPVLKKNSIQYKKLSINKINDTMKIDIQNGMCSNKGEYINKANCLKRLVSKKKRRFENEFFDLDMAYITDRVVAMGFPSSGCETIYRNSLTDIKKFIDVYYKDKGAKIYNLCIEKERIYSKFLFNNNSINTPLHLIDQSCSNCPVGLFPFKDHNPPPIKLILEFCIDICIYLTKNPDAVALIHCKAGKGRTGLMIICYMIFTELADAQTAIKHYAYMRTFNNKGVTIPSQIRFIRYFDTFLKLNYKKPYVKMIPKMIKNQFYKSLDSHNMICNYINDKTYFLSSNSFNIKELKIGPFLDKRKLGVKIFNNELKKINYDCDTLLEEENNDEGIYYYFSLNFNNFNNVETDLKFDVQGYYKFYFWINLWYSTVDYISELIRFKILKNSDNSNKKNLKSSETIKDHHDDKEINLVKEDKKLNKSKTFYIDHSQLNSLDSKSSIFMKDDINLNNYQEKEISENKSKLKKYLDFFNSNSNLNDFIDLVNNCLEELNEKKINKKSLRIKLQKHELDKFFEIKSVLEDFQAVLIFEIN